MEISKVTIQDLDQILEIELKYFTGFEFYSKNALTDIILSILAASLSLSSSF